MKLVIDMLFLKLSSKFDNKTVFIMWQQERMEKEAEVRRVRAELLRKAREEDPLA